MKIFLRLIRERNNMSTARLLIEVAAVLFKHGDTENKTYTRLARIFCRASFEMFEINELN